MNKRFMLSRLWLCICVISACVLLCGCQKQKNDFIPKNSVEELKAEGTTIGVQTGSSYDELTKSIFPKSEIKYYNSITDMAYCTSVGEIDSFAVSEVVARMLEREVQGISHLPEYLEELDVAFVLPKTDKGEKLRNQVNEFIETLKKNGILDEITEAWVSDDKTAQVSDYEALEGKNGTIDLAVESSFAPYCFVRDGLIVGIDLDIITRFCMEYGYTLSITDMNFDSIIPSLGVRCDMGTSGMTYSEERAEQVLFSVPYSSENTVMVVRNVKGSGENGFLTGLRESFSKTFVKEERWKLIVKGIETTVIISALAAFVGTILGFGICLLRLTKNRFAFSLTSAYIRILQGTPMVVFLMILYYIVFAKTSLSGELVSVIAFALNFSAYVSEMIRTGIESVDRGQTEAALAIGYTKSQAFFRIVMPQASANFLPVYKGELISLLKSTSIVGYIAVQDLTKMSDIIRSRTYEAFFPLIVTALIYFLIAAVMAGLLRMVELKLEPDREKRTVKGVIMR